MRPAKNGMRPPYCSSTANARNEASVVKLEKTSKTWVASAWESWSSCHHEGAGRGRGLRAASHRSVVTLRRRHCAERVCGEKRHQRQQADGEEGKRARR